MSSSSPHSDSSGSPSPTMALPESSTPSPQPQQQQTSRQPCRYLTSPGGCRYGDACRFMHPTDISEQQQQQQHHHHQQQQHFQQQYQIAAQQQFVLQQQQQSPSPTPPQPQQVPPQGFYYPTQEGVPFDENTSYIYPQQQPQPNIPASPYQTATPYHPSPTLTPSPYQGPHIPPPYPTATTFPTSVTPATFPTPPQPLTPYQLYTYQYQQQQVLPYMQHAAHQYAAAGYTPQQQQQMLHQLAMSIPMMPPIPTNMETRGHLTRRDKNNINAQGMCKYFVAGKCNYGGACRFPHDVMTAMAYQQQQYNVINGTPRTPQSSTTDVDTLSENMDSIHLQSPPTSQQRRIRQKSGSSSPSGQICRYYHQNTCRFGDQCKFQHIDVLPTTPITTTASSYNNNPNENEKLGTSSVDRQHVYKSLQITEKSSDMTESTSSIPNSHVLIIYHSRFSSTHTFMDLVQHERDACITFMHDIMEFMEYIHHIMDYCMIIEQTVAQEYQESKEEGEGEGNTGSFRVRILYDGDTSQSSTRTPPASDQLGKTLIHTTPHNRIWFDYKGRPHFIITPQTHIERLNQLDDAQLYSLWYDPMIQLRREYENIVAKQRKDEEGNGEQEMKSTHTTRLPYMTFQSLILNFGSYRHSRDLHLKMIFDPSLFSYITSSWSSALQQRWSTTTQTIGNGSDTNNNPNSANKSKKNSTIKPSANKENRKSLAGSNGNITPSNTNTKNTNPIKQSSNTVRSGWASIVNKTPTTASTTVAPSILPTKIHINSSSSSESSTSSSPSQSPTLTSGLTLSQRR